MLNRPWLFFKARVRFLKTGMFADVDQLGICFCLEIPSFKMQAFSPNCLMRGFPVNGQLL